MLEIIELQFQSLHQIDRAYQLLSFGCPPEYIEAALIENSLMSVLWGQVIDACGYSQDKRVSTVPVETAPMRIISPGNFAAAALMRGGIEVHLMAYGIGTAAILSDEEIRACMAHELGHIVNGDLDAKRNNLDSETEADEFAAKHGFARDLARALETLTGHVPDEETAMDGVHVRTSERVMILNLLSSK